MRRPRSEEGKRRRGGGGEVGKKKKERERGITEQVERYGPGPNSDPGLGARHTPLTRGEAGSCLAVYGQVGEEE